MSALEMHVCTIVNYAWESMLTFDIVATRRHYNLLLTLQLRKTALVQITNDILRRLTQLLHLLETGFLLHLPVAKQLPCNIKSREITYFCVKNCII